MELTINNITKQYGNVTVLDDVSYRFTPGIYGIAQSKNVDSFQV